MLTNSGYKEQNDRSRVVRHNWVWLYYKIVKLNNKKTGIYLFYWRKKFGRIDSRSTHTFEKKISVNITSFSCFICICPFHFILLNSLSFPLLHTHTHIHSLSLLHTNTHTHILSLFASTHTLSLSLSLSHTLYLSLFLLNAYSQRFKQHFCLTFPLW